MLIIASTVGHGIVFDPQEAPGKLRIVVETDELKEFGVFSGQHAGFEYEAEMCQRMPTVKHRKWSGFGMEVFEITRPSRARRQELRSYHYAVISKVNAVYTVYPSGKELALTEHYPNKSKPYWEVRFAGVSVILPDFKPCRDKYAQPQP